MRIRFLDWNINGFTAVEAKGELLAEMRWDVCALQEVTRDAWTSLLRLVEPADAGVAFDHMPRLEGKHPVYHTALLVREPFQLHEVDVLHDVPSPERTLQAAVIGGGARFTVASLAAPPGVSWGNAKCRQDERIAAWCVDRRGPLVFGMDANTPKWDRHELADTEWWKDREAVMFGVDRPHDLRDVYREHLRQNPEEWEAIRGERPDGPLAISYDRGNSKNPVACRYDVIFASPEFEVDHVEYRYDQAIDAGSDHALVMAELRLGPDG